MPQKTILEEGLYKDLCDEISLRTAFSSEEVEQCFINSGYSLDNTIKHLENCLKLGLDPTEQIVMKIEDSRELSERLKQEIHNISLGVESTIVKDKLEIIIDSPHLLMIDHSWHKKGFPEAKGLFHYMLQYNFGFCVYKFYFNKVGDNFDESGEVRNDIV